MGAFRVLLLLMLVCASHAVVDQTECPFEWFPYSFNGPAFLGFDGQVQLHDRFRFNFTQATHTTYFTLQSESVVRVSAQSALIDTTLWVYPPDKGSAATLSSGGGVNVEQVVRGSLAAGTYRLVVQFAAAQPTTCETLLVAVAIVPKTEYQKRVNDSAAAVPCTPERWPAVAPLNPALSHWAVADATNLRFETPGPRASKAVRWLYTLNFTVPTATGPRTWWALEAELGLDFLSSGSVGMLLRNVARASELAAPCGALDDCLSAPWAMAGRRVLKQLLVGGDYQIVLYDLRSQRVPVRPACTPFSFRMTLDRVVESESFLSCSAAPIPTSLNAPGFLTRDLRLDVNRDFVLDATTRQHNITLTLPEMAGVFFRAMTAQHTLIDIDLRLRAPNGTYIASSTLPRPQEEHVVAFLEDAGTYVLELIYWGQFAASNCETFHLVIATAPLSAATDYCAGLTGDNDLNVPDPSPDVLDSDTHSFGFASSAGAPLVYRNRAALDWHLDGIHIDDTVTNAHLLVRVGGDFLLGHLQLYLQPVNNADGTAARPIIASVKHGFLELSEFLQPGYYSLHIVPGPMQRGGGGGDLTRFPTCVKFTFEMNITAAGPDADPTLQNACWQWPALPESLEQPQYLANPSEQMYLSGRFELPPGSYATRSILFYGGAAPSLMRAYVDPHSDDAIDLDLALFHNGVRVASSMGLAGRAEQLVWNLIPKEEYELQVQVYNNRAANVCDSFGFELAIEPIPATLWDGFCEDVQLLPRTFIPSDAQNWPASLVEDFAFSQVLNETHRFELVLNLTEAAFVRVRVTYEFLWGALAIQLYDGAGRWLQDGVGGENSNSLGTVRLEPGDYTIVLSHSGVPLAPDQSLGEDESSVRCTAFELHAAIGGATGGDEEAGPFGSEHPCPNYPLPTTWNAPFALHPLSGQAMHVTQRFLMNTNPPAGDSVTFNVSVDSLFRVYVPYLSEVDVDVRLDTVGGDSVFSSAGRGEESRVHTISAGRYVFHTRYYQQLGGRPLPPTRSCPWFPMQVAIVPLARVSASPAARTGANCGPVSAPPTALTATGSWLNMTGGNFTHAVTATAPFVHNITLTLASDSLLRFELESDFASGAIWARVISSDHTLLPVMGVSRGSFLRTLEAGTWTLQLYYPKGDDPNPPPSQISCNTFAFHYALEAGVSGACNLYPPPTDLTSHQSADDGSLHFYQENVRAPAKGAKSYVRFNVTTASVWRLLIVSVGSTVVDVDFRLYNTTSGAFDAAHMVGVSNSGGRIEDTRLVLPPLTNDSYTLELVSFSVRHDSAQDCPALLFYMLMEPVASVHERRLCPPHVEPALPPTSLTFAPGMPAPLNHTSFTLTHEMLVPFEGFYEWAFAISLEVRENMTLHAEVASDALAYDVWLRLSPHAAAVTVAGLPDSASTENLFIMMDTQLGPGLYTLSVHGRRFEDLWSLIDGGSDANLCTRFSLDVTGTQLTSGTPTTPTLVAVSPASQEGLNPRLPLVLEILFDHIVDVPARATFQNDVASGLFIYLTARGSDVRYSGSATLGISRTSAYVTFRGLVHDQVYTLHVDAKSFKSNNVSFVAGPTFGPYTYATQSCACGSHGACNAAGVCVCTTGYRGANCTFCADGYHGVGSECQLNLPCTPASCGTHGNCSNIEHGVPHCTCHDGYATATQNEPCGACAVGFDGYPTCTLVVQDALTTCGLPLLPTSLDGPGGLALDGAVHVSGRYYLDLIAARHPVYFSVAVESVVRVYVEPHAVDVDLSLHRNLGDGVLSQDVLAGSYAFAAEEVIFVVVPPGSYAVLFTYNGVGGGVTFGPCESAQVELMVRGAADVRAGDNNNAAVCGRSYPTLLHGDAPFNESSVELALNVPLSYRPASRFAAQAIVGDGNQRVLAQTTLHVPVSTGIHAGLRAHLRAEIAYRFDSGDLALLLVRGYRTFASCVTPGIDCLPGTNGYDRNVVNAVLSPGQSYTLYVYEPVAQNPTLSKCSLYEFALDVEWRESSTSDMLGCAGGRMPERVLETGYGVHWAQVVALTPRAQNTTFVVGAQGAKLRVALSIHDAGMPTLAWEGLDVALFRDGVQKPVANSFVAEGHPTAELFYAFEAGTYTLSLQRSMFMTSAEEYAAKCRFVNVELEYVNTATPPVPSRTALGCPATASLPVVPMPLPIPYNLSSGAPLITYYAMAASDETLFQIPFVLEEESVISAHVWSAFLPAHARLFVHAADVEYARIESVSQYNAARIDAVRLGAGAWVLAMKFVSPNAEWPCQPFHFGFSVHSLRDVQQATAATNVELAALHCAVVTPGGFDWLPSTLSSWRFLNYDGRLDFHSERVLLPVQARLQSRVSHLTTFRVREPSALRISTSFDGYGVSLQYAVYNSDTGAKLGESTYNPALGLVVQPNVNYHVNWTAFNWNADPIIGEGEAPWCRAVSVHLVIKPLAWGALDAALCVGGASKFPDSPLIPPSLKVPSSLSPGAPYVAGQGSYHLQQSENTQASQSYRFTLDRPSNVLVELRFDMAFLMATVTLSSADGAVPGVYHTSLLSATGSTLLVNGVRAGTFSLSIQDRTGHEAPELYGCRPFTFRLTIEEDVASKMSRMGLVPVPDDLDDIGYLGYGGGLHIAHHYELVNVHVQSLDHRAELTNLTARTASHLRVLMRLPTNQQHELVPTLVIADLTDPRKSMTTPVLGTPELLHDHALEAGHTYQIGWSAVLAEGNVDVALTLPSMNLPVYVELAVHSTSSLQAAVASSASFKGPCTTSAPLLPTIALDPGNGGFVYANDALVVAAAQTLRPPGTVLAASPFVLDEESVLFAVLEKQFSLSRVVLEVANTVTKQVLPTTRDRNRQFVHELLPVGQYEMRLVLQNASDNASLAPCEPLSLHVLFRSNWQGSPSHVADCSAYDLLPWNLSSETGGSKPFGGPMNAQTGAMAIFGDHFLYPEVTPDADAYSFVEFSTETKRSLHVLLYFKLSAYEAGAAVLGNAGGTSTEFSLLGWNEAGAPFTVAPYSDMTARDFRLATFRLDEAKGALMQLDFTAMPQGLGTCPYYAFAAYSLESGALADGALCTVGQQAAQTARPNAAPVLDAVNGTVFERAWGALPTSGPAVVQLGPVRFTLTRASVVHYALAVNGFLSRVFINVTDVATGFVRVLPVYEDHRINVRVSGTEYLEAGAYSVSIVHESLAHAAGLVNSRGLTATGTPLCLPWDWTLWIAPYVDPDVIRVVGVTPASLRELRPNADLTIDVTVADTLYAADPDDMTGKAYTLATHKSILRAFGLVNTATKVLTPPSSVSSNSYTAGFTLVWKAGTLADGQTYNLTLREGILTGPEPDKKELTLFSGGHTYAVISAARCGAHGKLVDYTCVCDLGWGGSDCSVCAVGYTGADCHATSASVCQQCSCGCDTDNSPLGTCDDSVTPIKCTCGPRYTGSACELCADASQQSTYPVCTNHPLPCPASCAHGYCDYAAGRCACTNYWSGPACDVCDARFVGLECDRCAPNWTGPGCGVCAGGWSGAQCNVCTEGWSGGNCEVPPKADALRYALIAFGVLVVVLVAVLAVLAIRRYKRKQEAQKDVYAMTTLGGMDEDEFFDDTLTTDAQPRSLLSQSEFNLRLSDEEDADF